QQTRQRPGTGDHATPPPRRPSPATAARSALLPQLVRGMIESVHSIGCTSAIGCAGGKLEEFFALREKSSRSCGDLSGPPLAVLGSPGASAPQTASGGHCPCRSRDAL